MNVRLIVGRKQHGVVHVYPLLCMDCEGDVFEWLNSWLLHEPRTDGVTSESEYRCVHCGFTVRLMDGQHQLEATDDKDGWVARRHVKKNAKTKAKDPSNERVEGGSALSGGVL